MATTLIDTRKPIMDQIHTSWDRFRQTKEAALFLYGKLYHESNVSLAKDFAEKDAPWTSKQSVLERNAVHANNLIRLYIALNIDVAYRMPIWQFFEIGNGVVGKIKEQIKLLKRIQKVLKLEQELEVHEPIPSATCLFRHTGNLSLDEIEADFKVKVKEAKAKAIVDAKRKNAAKRRNAALRRAKKEQKRKDAAKNSRKALKYYTIILTLNHGKTAVLKMLKNMETDGYTIKDVIAELERQLH